MLWGATGVKASRKYIDEIDFRLRSLNLPAKRTGDFSIFRSALQTDSAESVVAREETRILIGLKKAKK
jgi:hypothetical protein